MTDYDVSKDGHTHAQADVTGLTAALSGKANSSHTHAQADVTGLTAALSGKANSSHTHAQADVTNLTSSLSGKVGTGRKISTGTGLTGGGNLTADRTLSIAAGGVSNAQVSASANIAQSKIQNLTSDLASKASSSHSHSQSDVTNLVSDLAGKASSSHSHAQGDVTGLTAALSGKADSSSIVPKTVVDAKGDLLVGTANDTVGRLPVGSNGNVLVADSSKTGGVKWAAPSGDDVSTLNPVVIGRYSSYDNSDTTVVGVQAKGSWESTALGYKAEATATRSIAIGSQAGADVSYSVAIGYQADTSGSNALALASGAVASGARSIAIGDGAEASGIRSIAIGQGATCSVANTSQIVTKRLELKPYGGSGESDLVLYDSGGNGWVVSVDTGGSLQVNAL